MKIVRLEEVSLEDICTTLDNGGLIIYPSDTCYGLGCDPTNKEAVDKLLKYKSRREGKAISIAVKDVEMARNYVEINSTAEKIYSRLLPGPFTVISKSKGKVEKGIEAEDNTLAIRIPDSEWFLNLISYYKKAITATSANQSYQKTPYKISDITDNLSLKSENLIDLIIDGGELKKNPPSTVLNTVLGDVQVLRKGLLLPEESKVNEFVSNSLEETIKFAYDLFLKFRNNLEFRPLIFALQGDLGAGKTQFTKGVAKALNINDQVLSPTFILSREYDSSYGIRLYHIDSWRLEGEDDLDELGFSSMIEKVDLNKINPDKIKIKNKYLFNVLSIEWADKVLDYLKKIDSNHKIIWVEITPDNLNENKRYIRWSE